jgi:hypothetical protein
MGLKGEVVESFQGVSINIMGQDEARERGLLPPSSIESKPAIPVQPVHITR